MILLTFQDKWRTMRKFQFSSRSYHIKNSQKFAASVLAFGLFAPSFAFAATCTDVGSIKSPAGGNLIDMTFEYPVDAVVSEMHHILAIHTDGTLYFILSLEPNNNIDSSRSLPENSLFVVMGSEPERCIDVVTVTVENRRIVIGE
jgi:hypothetical protein